MFFLRRFEEPKRSLKTVQRSLKICFYNSVNKAKYAQEHSFGLSKLLRGSSSQTLKKTLVGSIDFSHSSRKACSILNNLTGRSRHSPRYCLVSANAIASQLVRNGKYEAVDRKSSRLVSQEVSDLCRATTQDAVNISDNFSLREFAAALQHLKPGKAPGLDSIFPELIFHAGAALKSWLRNFISSCLLRLKIPKI